MNGNGNVSVQICLYVICALPARFSPKTSLDPPSWTFEVDNGIAFCRIVLYDSGGENVHYEKLF